MKSEVVAEDARATLDGSMAFAEIVGRLIETGVEYYHVDYVALQKTFYSATGEMIKTPITYENLPSIAADFDVDALKAAILDSQQNRQHYKDFSKRVMNAGVRLYGIFAWQTRNLLGSWRR